jgi:hypothetical protein
LENEFDGYEERVFDLVENRLLCDSEHACGFGLLRKNNAGFPNLLQSIQLSTAPLSDLQDSSGTAFSQEFQHFKILHL